MLLPEVPLGDGDVVLRAWQPADAPWYAQTSQDPLIQRWTTEPAGLTAATVVEAITAMHATRADAGMAITDAATGQLLGNAGLARCRDDPHTGEISYWLAPEARGRGAATRAVRLLVAWAWRCGLRRVQLYTHVDNIASQRVAAQAGLHRGRIIPDHRLIKGQYWTVVTYHLDRPPPGTDPLAGSVGGRGSATGSGSGG